MSSHHGPPTSVADVLAQLSRPPKAVVTAGMPYANGPLHIGHLAGAHLPADITARWLGMWIGRENVLFVCGTDEHGSTSEVAALNAGVPLREFVDHAHDSQAATLSRYNIGLDIYSGTSRPECLPLHTSVCQTFLERLWHNQLLQKRTSLQWYDPKMERFLPDRFVRGRCPNPKCGNEDAYSNECERCGHQYDSSEVQNPRSTISDATPELRETLHWWLDMWTVSDSLQHWLEGKSKSWRRSVLADALDRVRPALRFEKELEPTYKELKGELPPHKSKYAPGKQVILQFADKTALNTASGILTERGIQHAVANEWAYRAITRDSSWGVSLPPLDPDLEGKTLYVWPDSLIAPITFSQLALEARGESRESYKEYWCNAQARINQFLGQDNVFFYVLMQGALWLGAQEDPRRLPKQGELQLTDVYGAFHLTVGGEKMSKSAGNFLTGDELLDERGYSADQIRYYLALLGLSDKPSDFDFVKLDDRNKFLSGPMNAAFERPISAAHSKFQSKVPHGTLFEKVEKSTIRMVQRYLRAMDRAEYPSMLFELENYARTINSLFSQYKPHDDRHPEPERAAALFNCFYVLKNLMIMLYPFVPQTMHRLRESLRLPPEVFSLSELGVAIPAGHEVGPKQPYFPTIAQEER